MGKGSTKGGKVAKFPKTKCCVSRTRCNRCPLRMLKEGKLPEGYTVRKRKLVKVEASLAAASKASKKKSKTLAA